MNTARGQRAAALLAGLGTVLFAAFARTEFHVVPTEAGAWRGLADAPGAGRLALAVLAGAVVAFCLRRSSARLARPLWWLALAAAPLVPLFSGRGLLLLLFQGPVLALLAAAVLAVVAYRLARPDSVIQRPSDRDAPPVIQRPSDRDGGRRISANEGALRRDGQTAAPLSDDRVVPARLTTVQPRSGTLSDDRGWSLAPGTHSNDRWRTWPRELGLLLVGFAFYAWLGQYLPGPAGPQGDEPHYLLMADSLLEDGDLDLANQFDRRTYRSFFAGPLQAHTSPATPVGTMYPVHTPGLALLIAPAFALGGYPAAKLLLSFLAALSAALLYRLVREVTGRPGLALAAWTTAAFVPPLPLYALAIYPETPAALATVVFLLSARDARPWRLAAATLGAAALPWLHPKFLPLALLGLLLTVARPGPRWARLAAAATFGLSLGGLLAWFASVYGHATLSAAYGPGLARDVSVGRIPMGLLALGFDRQFGLAAIAPLWLLAAPGLLILARARLGDALRALLLGGASLAAGASFSMWWGGACPPGRFVVPALPALALALAAAWRRRPAALLALLAIGATMVLLAAGKPSALHNRADGESGLLHFLAPALDLDRRLPSFVLGDWTAVPLALTLATVLGLAWAYGGRGLALGSVGYALVSLSLQASPLLDARNAVAQLLDSWDEARFSATSGKLALDSLRVPLELPAAPWLLGTGDVRRSRRMALPPGLYRLEIDAQPGPTPTSIHLARLEAQTGAISLDWVFLRTDRPLQPMVLPLPVGAPRLMLVASGVADQSRVTSARLVPLELLPLRLRETLRWPAVPEQDRYRVGTDALRVTVLDRSEPEGDGFRLDGAWGAFVLESAPGAVLLVHLERPHAAADDELRWGEQVLRLGAATGEPLALSNGSTQRLGPAALLPVYVRSQGAHVRFSTLPALE